MKNIIFVGVIWVLALSLFSSASAQTDYQMPQLPNCSIVSAESSVFTENSQQKIKISWNTNCAVVSFQGIEQIEGKGFSPAGSVVIALGQSEGVGMLNLLGTNDKGCPGLAENEKGERCMYQTKTIEVSSIPKEALTDLYPGCARGMTYSTTTGKACPVNTLLPKLFTKNLKLGMRDTQVSLLQQRLMREGVYRSPITGYFGLLTQEGVKNYQKKVGLPQVGNVGPLTLKSLNNQ